MNVTQLFSPPVALAVGLVVGLGIGNPWTAQCSSWSKRLLQWSVVGLGFGLDLGALWEAGRLGIGFTVGTIFGTLLLGTLLGRALRIEAPITRLISSGTAICGGSAIAAVGSATAASPRTMSVALVTVFVLNALALFIFPPIGHALGLSQKAFGVWAAIAIHDTSSVVGAAAKYGDEALAIATTIKLSRALWIIPASLFFAWRSRVTGASIRWPWFILWFVLAAVLRTLLPAGEPIYAVVHDAAKAGLTVTLLLIGASLSRDALRATGLRPLLLGVMLWLVVGAVGLWTVRSLVIS